MEILVSNFAGGLSPFNMFYEEQPADFTYLSFNPIMLQFRRRISDPTIFQHMGRNSSLSISLFVVE
jgi:hypothetical protein